jgi:hypothetical protein
MGVGLLLQQIADKYGVDKTRIWQICKKGHRRSECA